MTDRADTLVENDILYHIAQHEKATGGGMFLDDLLYCTGKDYEHDELILSLLMKLISEGRVEFSFVREMDVFVDLNKIVLYATLPAFYDPNSDVDTELMECL